MTKLLLEMPAVRGAQCRKDIVIKKGTDAHVRGSIVMAPSAKPTDLAGWSPTRFRLTGSSVRQLECQRGYNIL